MNLNLVNQLIGIAKGISKIYQKLLVMDSNSNEIKKEQQELEAALFLEKKLYERLSYEEITYFIRYLSFRYSLDYNFYFVSFFCNQAYSPVQRVYNRLTYLRNKKCFIRHEDFEEEEKQENGLDYLEVQLFGYVIYFYITEVYKNFPFITAVKYHLIYSFPEIEEMVMAHVNPFLTIENKIKFMEEESEAFWKEFDSLLVDLIADFLDVDEEELALIDFSLYEMIERILFFLIHNSKETESLLSSLKEEIENPSLSSKIREYYKNIITSIESDNILKKRMITKD